MFFKLSLCVYDQGYTQFVRTMFQDIRDNGIENIIVDLRGNPGGNSAVVDEFLKYLDIEEYKSFGGTRRLSAAAAEQRPICLSADPSPISLGSGRTGR